jgi:hypothetical protein
LFADDPAGEQSRKLSPDHGKVSAATWSQKTRAAIFPKMPDLSHFGSRLLSSHFPESYEAITYGRGTWLFHMLRSMLQDAATEIDAKGQASRRNGARRSLRALPAQSFASAMKGKSISSTRELLDVFAEDLPPSLRYEGKASLDWFLDGWVNGTSLPRIELQKRQIHCEG